jgi:acetylornithine deacetylase
LGLTSSSDIELLSALVATKSVSGDEEAVAELVLARALALGLDARRDKTGVFVTVAGEAGGPTLALVSHLDTVPPGNGWTRDPFEPKREGDRLYGRGSGDAKASVTAMLHATADVLAAGGPRRGRLLVIFGHSEETRDTTMGEAVKASGTIDAAIVGEPTNLEVATAQRGLMMAELVGKGDQRHAGYASEGGFVNAVTELATDLVKLHTLAQTRPHALLGQPTLTATMVEAGVSRNVTPPVAKAVLDIRSTPAWTHPELAAELKKSLRCELVVTSERLVPCETPPDSRLLACLKKVRPAVKTFGSPTCSDWVFLRQIDTIKCGPGTSRRSHTADEYVDLPEVSAARELYTRVALEYLS